MSTFLETLKLRLVEAQRQHQETTAKFQKAQAEFTASAQKMQSWQLALQAETQREQAEAAQAQANGGAPQQETPATPMQSGTTTASAESPIRADVNKTQIIREQLRQHPAGMTGAELWNAVKTQIPARPYVYSVLKRLKDKDEVILRKKKYRLVPKPGEDVEAHTVQ